MHKALLVDDDLLVRVGLRMMIDWKTAGWEIVGEAINGIQALEMIDRWKPDLLIVDMKMPQMDGAELLKVLRNQNKHIKMIVLSCYDDYNYMREALTHGANEYILKPELNKQLLAETLQRIKQQITEEENRDKEYYELKKQAALNTFVAHEIFYRDLLRGKYQGNEEIQTAFLRNGIHIAGPYYGIAVFSAEIQGDSRELYVVEKKEAVMNSVFNILQGVFSSHFSVPLLHGEEEGVFITMLHGHQEKKVAEEMETLTQRAIQAVNMYTQLTLTAGISAISCDLSESRRVLKQAQDLLKYRLLFGGNRSFSGWGLPPDHIHFLDYTKLLHDHYQALFTSLAGGETQQSKMLLSKLLEYVRESGSMKVLQAVCSELAGWYNKHLTVSDLNQKYVQCPDYMSVDELMQCRNLVELAELFLQRCIRLDFDLVFAGNAELSPTVRKALDFIRTNYHQNIGLTDLADYVCMSKSHLSVVFREQTGLNFVEYVTNYRIEQAKRLLRMEDLRIYEVASKVGFESERYFSQVFRAKVGVTPTEFKKMTLC